MCGAISLVAAIRGIKGHVLTFQAQPLAAGAQQGAQYPGLHAAIRHPQYFGVRVGQGQAFDVRGAVVILVEQVQVGTGAVIDEQRFEVWMASVNLHPFEDAAGYLPSGHRFSIPGVHLCREQGNVVARRERISQARH